MIYVIKKLNILLILFVLLIVSLGAVSAADNVNETLGTNEISQGDEILTASQHTVTSSNYNSYFSGSGELIGSVVNTGDTLNLSGDFSGKDFIINKNITVAGSGGTITNGIVKLTSGASGSAVHDLKIRNTENFHQGIYLLGATNCAIYNNNIENKGQSSYAITLIEGADYNKVYDNTLRCQGADYGHGTRSTSVILLGRSNNNIIENNDIKSDDANAIYLSSYPGGEFKGGESFNNIIRNNNIKYMVNVTSWAYGIQLMGGNNTVQSNKINGAYRGVSSSNFPLNKVINNTIYVTGIDFSSKALSGGDYGIAIAANATVKDNTITGLFVGSGISVGDYSVVENNFVNASKGYGIEATGDNVQIINNEIYTVSSAGIHQQGKFEGIVVDRNTIISQSGIGVLLSKSSKTKYPSNIKITNNHIETSNTYMINAAEADKDSWTINNNTGTGKILTPSGEVDPTIPDFYFNGTTHNITPANYHSYIDGDGNLLTDVVHDGDILNFTGKFENKQILVSSTVKLTGPNPIFTNSTICVTSDSVWIENLTIINKNASHNAWGIFVADTKVIKIINNDITVYDPTSAYAVYIYKSSKVYVEKNKLTSHGSNLTYTLLGYGAEECEFKENTVNCIGTGIIHQFESSRDINGNASEVCIGQCICLGDVLKEHCLDGTNIVPELYRTYGILMIKSSNNTLVGNDVSVTSLVSEAFVKNSTNSLVGIDFYYDCDNNLISNNKINVTGLDNYLYGAGAIAYPTSQVGSSTARNNTFIFNEISVNGYEVAEGLIFGEGCDDTKALGNTIDLNAANTIYGITLESSHNSKIMDNHISMASDAAYGIEAYKSNSNLIENNIISGEGKLIAGFAGTNTNNNVIRSNTITSKGTDSNKNMRHDVIKAANSGIYMEGASKGNLVDSNNITTELGYPVDLSADSKGNTVTYNYLKGEKGSGDKGVNNSLGNTVHDNYVYEFNNIVFDSITAPYNSNIVLSVKTDNLANGANVVFRLGDKILGNTVVKDAKAELPYQLTADYNVGNYTITASLTKEGFKSSEVTADLKIVKDNLTVNVDNVTAKSGENAQFTAIVVNSNNKPVSNMEVKFSRNAQYIGAAKTDANGKAVISSKIPTSLEEGNYAIFATLSESANYNQAIGQGSLEVVDPLRKSTKIEAKDIIMYYKDGTRLVATLLDEDGKVLSNVNVSVTINGVTRNKTTDNKGQTSSALGLPSGIYTASFKFNGTSVYKPSSANCTVEIKSTVSGKDITKIEKASKPYVAIFLDSKGNPLAKGTEIEFNINGVFYKRNIGDNGEGKLNLNLGEGKYTITAINTKTGENAANTVIIKPRIVNNTDVTKYYKNDTQYHVTVLDDNGNPVKAGETVTFNINGVFYKRTTNDKGVAELKLNLPPGDYVITAEYKGCKVANNIKILPVLSAKDLTKKYGDTTPFTANLVDGQGKPLAKKEITFNINGVFYNKVTDDTGVARLNINLPSGQYIITSSYNGANIANRVTVTS